MQRPENPTSLPAALADLGVAVVVPIFRHSVLLAEAVESLLDQTAPFAVHVVLVNDGCPHRETDDACREYARAHPDRITYLRKPNGGLSDARNHGIRHALAHLPDITAVYMMDADNRLRPQALARAMAELSAAPQIDWVYPNIDMFGLAWSGDFGGAYSVLLHTRMNLCEAGSLIHRRVFEAGVFFDTGFKSGFEDWDFFLTAAEAGFRGRNLENFGFLYRKRGESMLAESEREAAVIKGELERKHKTLFAPRSLATLEQAEAPRFAIVLADRGDVRLTLDPGTGLGSTVSFAEYEELWWRAQIAPSRYHAPPFLVVTRSEVLEQLAEMGLLHAAFWMLERQLADYHFAGLALEVTPTDRLSHATLSIEGKAAMRAQMVMIGPQILKEVSVDSSMAWAKGLASTVCRVPASLTRLSVPDRNPSVPLPAPGVLARLKSHLPGAAPAPERGAAADAVAVMTRLQTSVFKAAAGATWDWRRPDIPWRQKSHLVACAPTGARAAFPKAMDGRTHVGFLLPLVEFGGVERVALNVAQALRRCGLVPHLFVLDARSCHYGKEWQDSFESVTFLDDKGFAVWGGDGGHYNGTLVSDWSRFGDHSNALAMLGWLDVVLNFHGGAISGIMGQLRRFGIKTGISLHLSDLSPFQRPVGNTYNGLAFEHGYDLFLPCSLQLADWCHAMGVPSEKIVPIPNAPGFPLPDASRDPARAHRSRRIAGLPLRVIYLGRLDTQKGVDRLLATVALCKAQDLPIHWRIIGKALFSGAETLPPEVAALIEPPLTAHADLAAALQDADVFFLPSFYEGLPLTMLEAMRSGVVPLVTDVGAVAEVLQDGLNGILLKGPDVAAEATAALRRLAIEPEFLAQLSARAQADMVGRDWDGAVAELVGRLRPATIKTGRT
jgi:glycosyltransferase involved in cell wall biosynthesis